MLIRNFAKPIDSTDEIENIKGKHRYIFIYRYATPHQTMNEVYGGNMYDIYLVNTSSINGVSYIIPSNLIVHVRNSYRGVAYDIVKKDGSLDRTASIFFTNGMYSTRVHHKDSKDVFKLNTADSLSGISDSENTLLRMINADEALPLPVYYNWEDQARLASTNYKSLDFEMNYNDVPKYNLNDLCDKSTTVAIINMDESMDMLYRADSDVIQFSGNKPINLGDYKDTIAETFIECYKSVLESVFSQADFIFDLNSGLFTISKDTLRLKYNFEIDKHMITTEYGALILSAANISDNLLSFDECGIVQGNLLDKLYIHISNTVCKIKLTSKDYRFHTVTTLSNDSGYSSSDGDEMTMWHALDDGGLPNTITSFQSENAYSINDTTGLLMRNNRKC